MKKKTTILSIFLAAFMALLLNVGNVKAAATGQDIVNYAKQFQGVPYVWGGTSPSGFDCSGFVQYVYRNAAGINLPRIDVDQMKAGTPVSRNNLQPGDLISPHPGHIGIYIGGGNVIHSPQTGDVVKISTIESFGGFYAGARIINTPQSYVKIDGGGKYLDGKPAINLIIRDYSSDIENVFAWVDSDTGASWAFAKQVPNSNYQQLSKNTFKTISKRNGGNLFTPGANYKITVKGYNKNRQVVAENQIVLKAPNGLDAGAKPIISGSFTVTKATVAREQPIQSAKVTGNLQQGQKVDVYAEYGNWYLVSRGIPRWVEKQYLAK
ncbi:NlpC/P60 family protein [Clostridium sp. L74]|uniref:NlpC/P60 family protein n=1 Tax=Clostridium sp. L74 TaxID=1560217 RepID=UPI0006ABA6DB|nr:NlpC/P60 family protein [Clostridium sp. L74]KOR24220.1 hypothetical protein ND00_29260 [Clostridium sp. L74]